MSRLNPSVTVVAFFLACACYTFSASANSIPAFCLLSDQDSTVLEWSCGPAEPCDVQLRTQTMGGWGNR